MSNPISGKRFAQIVGADTAAFDNPTARNIALKQDGQTSADDITRLALGIEINWETLTHILSAKNDPIELVDDYRDRVIVRGRFLVSPAGDPDNNARNNGGTEVALMKTMPRNANPRRWKFHIAGGTVVILPASKPLNYAHSVPEEQAQTITCEWHMYPTTDAGGYVPLVFPNDGT